jgi:hypothetical protein
LLWFAFAGLPGKENSGDLAGQKCTIVDRHLVYFAMHPPNVAIHTQDSAHEKRRSIRSINLIILPPRYRDTIEEQHDAKVAGAAKGNCDVMPPAIGVDGSS